MNEFEELKKFWEGIDAYKETTHHINELQKTDYFVPFIGAGMSVKFGFPTWENVLNQLKLSKLNKSTYLKMKACKIFEREPKNIPEQENYLCWFSHTNKIKTIVTTNIDEVIEKYISFDNIFLPNNMQEAGEIRNSIQHNKKTLIKLNGTCKNEDLALITYDDFLNHYNENTIGSEILEYIWHDLTLLFIGCGLNLNDPLTAKMINLAKKHKFHHYAILEYPNTDILGVKSRELDLINMNIRPIWFEKDRYNQILVILKMILDIEGKKAEREPNNTTDNAGKILDQEKEEAKEKELQNNNPSNKDEKNASEKETKKSQSRKYKIGVTFTGKYRKDIVEPICNALIKNHYYNRKDIFYDAWHTTEIVGISADEILQNIYKNQCECIVVFLSKDYKEKFWTNNIEWKSIKELITTSDKKRILLFNMDSLDIDTIDGLNSRRDIYIDINSYKKDGKISIDSIAMDIDEFYEKIRESND